MAGQVHFEHNGKIFNIPEGKLLTWEESDIATGMFSPEQQKMGELIREAKTMDDKLRLAREMQKSTSEQRAFVKKMLIDRVGLNEDQLKKMALIDALLIYNKYIQACNDISPFLEQPSEPAS